MPPSTHAERATAMPELITIIGGTNQGKSYTAKQMVRDPKINLLVYDVQNGYGPTSAKPGDIIMNLPLDWRAKRGRFYGDTAEFLHYANHREKTTILIEEATIFFEGRTYQAMRKLIVDKWHVQNNIIIIFHTINSVPPRILEMTDIVILFKTGDDENTVKSKYRKLLPHMLALRNKPDRTKLIINNFTGEVINKKNDKPIIK